MQKFIRTHGFFLIFCTIFCAEMSCGAQAEDMDVFGFHEGKKGTTSILRQDPFSYQNEPIQFGSFRVWPNLTLQQEYRDNIYATESGTVEDFVSVVKPSLLVEKNMGRHNFKLSLEGALNQYWDHSSENTRDLNARFSGDIEVWQGLNIPLRLSYIDQHIERDGQRRSSALDLSSTPLEYKTYGVETGIVYAPNRLSVSLTGGFKGTRLQNNTNLNTGLPTIRNHQDTDTYMAKTRVSYKTGTAWEPYIEAALLKENYIRQASGSTPRDNRLFKALIGASFDYKGLIFASFGVGFDKRDYDSTSISASSNLSLKGRIQWNPTERTRLDLDFGRKSVEDNQIVQGLTETWAGLVLSREVRRDLFLRLKADASLDKYNTILRSDTTWALGPEIVYMIGPDIQLGGEYRYMNRHSDVSGLDLDSSIFLLKLIKNF